MVNMIPHNSHEPHRSRGIAMLRPMFAVFAIFSCTALIAAPVPGPKAPDYSKLTEDSIKKWAGAEVLLLAKIEKVTAGPVGLSDPPLRTYRLTIAPAKILRGSAKLDKSFIAHYSYRNKND